MNTIAKGNAVRSSASLSKTWLLLIVILLAIICSLAWPSKRGGDGFEYLAMSVAIARHGSPDIWASDLENILRRNNGVPADGATETVARNLAQAMRQGRGAYGVSRAEHGHFYSYHFWLYSALNAPALAICSELGAPIYSSFLVTNGACMLLMGFVITYLAPWTFRRKMLMVLLALGSGSTFYLGWSGPETMCFVSIVIGLVLLEMPRYGWALLAFAAGAQQNPPIGFLAIVAGLMASWNIWGDLRKGAPIRHVAWKVAALVPGSLLLIASPLFYMIAFGTPNLIIKSGSTDLSLISWGRMVSLLFDLNQGMIIATPAIFIFVVALLIAGFWARSRTVGVTIALLGVMLLMAVPVLSQTNWNGGEIIISRYAYWLSAPLVYACALLMDALLRNLSFTLASGALMAAQCAVLAWLGVFGTRYFYVGESPLAMWVLDHHPAWYAPIPEIFVERGNHIDGGFRRGYSYLYVHNMHMTIVLSNQQRVFGLDILCGAKQIKSPSRETEQGWSYRYLGRSCPVDMRDGLYQIPDLPIALTADTVHAFTVASPSASMGALPGFKTPENWGVWTDQRLAVLPLRVPASVDGQAVNRWMVTLAFHPFAGALARVPVQRVIVTANGMEGLNVKLGSMATVTPTFVARSMPWDGQWNALLLEFHIPTAVSYKELGLSGDPSRLGIGLETIKVEPLRL